MKKYCRKCQTETHRNKGGGCATCNTNRLATLRRDHPEVMKKYATDWYAKNKKKANAWSKAYHTANPNANHKKNLKIVFGLTLEDYEGMLKSQNGVCYLCKKPESMKRKGKTMRLSVDHCHSTGVNRKLLCKSCNSALGYAKDDPLLLRRMADYLEEYKKG